MNLYFFKFHVTIVTIFLYNNCLCSNAVYFFRTLEMCNIPCTHNGTLTMVYSYWCIRECYFDSIKNKYHNVSYDISYDIDSAKDSLMIGDSNFKNTAREMWSLVSTEEWMLIGTYRTKTLYIILCKGK